MKTATLTLTTESFLLPGSGEGAVLIDADVVFHPSGLPFIPGRRIKGLLKESVEEILEMHQMSQSDMEAFLEKLFGKPGTNDPSGMLVIPNLYPPDWAASLAYLEKVEVRESVEFQPEQLRRHFTREIQQTAIDRESGIAANHSLRNYRVLLPRLPFSGQVLTTAPLEKVEMDYLQAGVQNLRYVGTRRNRGFGKVSCELTEFQTDVVSPLASYKEGVEEIQVRIRLDSPVVMARMYGDQNTVATERSISGNHLRGLLANAYLQKNPHSKSDPEKELNRSNAHEEEEFFALFLAGKLTFGNLNLAETSVLPLHYHQFKGVKSRTAFSDFIKEKREKEHKLSKPIGGRVSWSANGPFTKVRAKTTFFFHNSRHQRSMGHSMKDQAVGGIFYYEALASGQEFVGTIQGSTPWLSKLLQSFPAEFSARLGKSRSAQYGRVTVNLSSQPASSNEKQADVQQLLLTCESPLILRNSYGLPQADTGLLTAALQTAWGLESPFTLQGVATDRTQVEQFNSAWQAKTDQMQAFQTGSCFLLQVPASLAWSPSLFLGELNQQGFGQVSLVPYNGADIEEARPKAPENGKKLPEPPPGFLQVIRTQSEQELRKQRIQTLAVEAINGIKSLYFVEEADKKVDKHPMSKHLISRLESWVQQAQSADEFQGWILDTKGKTAGKQLENAKLVDMNHHFSLIPDGLPNSDQQPDFVALQWYWSMYFQTLRKLKKQYKFTQS